MTATVYRATRGPLTQTLIRADLEDPSTLELYRRYLPEMVHAVYSDPPWNPGNATYWRTHARDGRIASYDRFLDGWCAVAALCQERGARDVLVEQSANVAHQDLLRAAIRRCPGWVWSERAVYPVRYGTGAKLLPNALLHFGVSPLDTDPSGMHGEMMTLRAVYGLKLPPADVIVDPCAGKGMTSRTAHAFGLHFVGSELNPERLGITLKWLRGQGYDVAEVEAGP